MVTQSDHTVGPDPKPGRDVIAGQFAGPLDEILRSAEGKQGLERFLEPGMAVDDEVVTLFDDGHDHRFDVDTSRNQMPC